MTHFTDILTNLLAFAFALGVIIVVHEAGHLMVAKAFGVRVLTFSIGFGRRLWGFTRGDTEYRVSLVPLGGYVRLGGENPDEISDDPREFLNKPRWQRILVYLAGPAMNVLLAIILIAGLFMAGIEVMSLPDTPPVIGGVEAGTSAAQAGLQRGDLILKVKGEAVEDWNAVVFALIASPDRPVPLTIRRGQGIQLPRTDFMSPFSWVQRSSVGPS
ncbi:MAG TPA: site-2 protease family protein [Thermoanaerobaculia bacterium]|nr:site-2 protease family protein [Thermoanaerobaculia bacterium]